MIAPIDHHLHLTIVMERLALIDALSAAALLAVWYFCFLEYNRRRAVRALHWVEVACSGKGRILQARWVDACHLHATIGFAADWLDSARVTVRLLPRPIPIQWLMSIWHNEKETLTFEADLDYIPGFQLQIYRHRWVSHNGNRRNLESQDWELTRPGAVVLTTRASFPQELTPVVNTLMTTRSQNLMSVRFRPQSPHLAATVALDALCGEEAAASFLNVIHDLAIGASTSRP